MEDIELVIKIPKEMYAQIINENGIDTMLIPYKDIIKNGTTLPKGHGTLKDTDAICKDIISALGIRDENYLLEAEEAIYKRIKTAQTIIEADKEQEE